MTAMSCVNPRTVLLAKLFTQLVYQLGLKGSGSSIAEPSSECPLTSKMDSRPELQLVAGSANSRSNFQKALASDESRPRADRGVQPLWSNPICLDTIPPSR